LEVEVGGGRCRWPMGSEDGAEAHCVAPSCTLSEPTCTGNRDAPGRPRLHVRNRRPPCLRNPCRTPRAGEKRCGNAPTTLHARPASGQHHDEDTPPYQDRPDSLPFPSSNARRSTAGGKQGSDQFSPLPLWLTQSARRRQARRAESRQQVCHVGARGWCRPCHADHCRHWPPDTRQARPQPPRSDQHSTPRPRGGPAVDARRPTDTPRWLVANDAGCFHVSPEVASDCVPHVRALRRPQWSESKSGAPPQGLYAGCRKRRPGAAAATVMGRAEP